MRLPSVDIVVRAALRTARRFPLVLAAAAVATIAGIAATGSGKETEYVRLLAVATLGLPLLYSLTVLSERPEGRTPLRLAIPLTGVAILAAFWALWSGWSEPIQAIRYMQLSAAFHLLAAFAPYAGSGSPNGFWQYNRILFLRSLTASIYSAVLYAGLAIALLAVEKLFAVHMAPQSYVRLWILIAFLFSTWFFLAGIPEDFAALDGLSDYPAVLKIFTQYVLVPLVVLYLAILTLYLGKVLLTRQWPSGWIGWLVSSVAVIGLLSWLLIHPLEEREEFAWVKAYTRGFYIALMPAVVMLWLAIYKRVAEYGITEPRYFLIVLSAWLGGISIWYTFTRSRNIKLIPASLCAIALVTFAGPTGAYSVSRASQAGRLAAILERNGLIANGHFQAGGRTVSIADLKELSGTVRYLLETHGSRAIGAWLPDSIRKTLSVVPAKGGSEFEARRLMNALGLEYVVRGAEGANEYFNYTTQNPQDAVAIDGYSYALHLAYWNTRDSLRVGDGYMLRLATDSTALQLSRGGEVVLAIPLQPLADSAAVYRRTHSGLTDSDVMRTEVGGEKVSALVYLTTLSGVRRAGSPRVTMLSGEVFLRLIR
jgi:hypothetical protein